MTWKLNTVRIGNARSTAFDSWDAAYAAARQLSAMFPRVRVTLDYVGNGDSRGKTMCRESFVNGGADSRFPIERLGRIGAA